MAALVVACTVVGAAWRPPTAVPVASATGGVVLGLTGVALRLPWGWPLAVCWVLPSAALLRGAAWGQARVATRQWVGSHADRDRPLAVEGYLTRDAVVQGDRAWAPFAVSSVDGVPFDPAIPASLSVAGALAFTAASDWTKGRRLSLSAALGTPLEHRNFGVERRWATWSRPFLATLSVKSAALVEVVAEASAWTETFARWRAAIRRRIARHVGLHGQVSAAVVGAIVLGERAGLEPAFVDELQRAGIYHVMALSGGNVAMVLAALFWLRRTRRPARRAFACGAASLLVGYASLVSAEASVVRALSVAALYVLASALDVRATPGHLLAVVAVGLLLLEPSSAFDVGAWLTFTATLALIQLVPLLDRGWDAGSGAFRWGAAPGRHAATVRPVAVASSCAAAGAAVRAVTAAVTTVAVSTVCVELALWPLSALAFGQVTLLGLVLNVAALPLMAVVQFSGMLVALAGETIAGHAGWLAHLAVEGLVATSGVAKGGEWLVFFRAPPALGAVAVYYGVLIVWAIRGGRLREFSLIVGAGAVVWVTGPTGWVSGAIGRALARERPPWLTMTALDVGQGDATLVQFPSGHVLLVDAGGVAGGQFDVGGRVVVPALAGLGITRLTHAAISHGDPDHIGGLASVIGRLTPHEIWEGIPVPGHRGIDGLRARAVALGISWRSLSTGDVVHFGDAEIRVVHPSPPDWERLRVRNDDSLVLVIRYGSATIVLAGDIGADVEQELGRRPLEGALRIVKMPHHGSRSSSSDAWIRWTRPSVAFASAGAGNRFGHPAPDVVERYRRSGAVVFSTSLDGAIRLRTNGRRVEVTTVGGRGFTIVAPAEVSAARSP